jgi:transcriptional regulator with XRE-family HTH domain
MTGSVVVRRSIGRRLKALRLAARKTQADVASVASPAKLKRMEGGQVAQRMADVRTLCFMYGADDATTEQLVELSLITSEVGWWESFTDAVPSWFAMYVELEAAASKVYAWDPELIYGLLQTPDYHRAVYEARPDLESGSVDQQVALRAGRQRAAFERTPPLDVVAIFGPGAVDRQVGGFEIAAEQRAHLISSPAEVRVLPARSGAHAAMKGAFTLLEYADDKDPDVVYLETHSGGRYIEQPDQVATYRRMFELIGQQSVPIEEYLK